MWLKETWCLSCVESVKDRIARRLLILFYPCMFSFFIFDSHVDAPWVSAEVDGPNPTYLVFFLMRVPLLVLDYLISLQVMISYWGSPSPTINMNQSPNSCFGFILKIHIPSFFKARPSYILHLKFPTCIFLFFEDFLETLCNYC